MENLTKKSISGLTFCHYNPNVSEELKQDSLTELKTRLKCISDFDSFMTREKSIINMRGYDLDNYLISDNPSMQIFMEVFFKYVHNIDFYERNLLFSEMHICNDASVREIMTKKIILAELKNVYKRCYDISPPEIYREVLEAIRGRLGNDIVIRKQPYYAFLEESDALNLFESFDFESMYKFFPQELLGDSNFSEYKTNHPIKARLYYVFSIVYSLLEDSILDSDFAQNLMTIGECQKDSKKVNRQKQLLLQQAKKGFEVDYSFLKK